MSRARVKMQNAQGKGPGKAPGQDAPDDWHANRARSSSFHLRKMHLKALRPPRFSGAGRAHVPFRFDSDLIGGFGRPFWRIPSKRSLCLLRRDKGCQLIMRIIMRRRPLATPPTATPTPVPEMHTPIRRSHRKFVGLMWCSSQTVNMYHIAVGLIN